MTATAQQFPTSGWSVKEDHATVVIGAPRAAPVVTGAPYSADQMQDYTGTLADGTTGTRSNLIGKYARDSQGRTWEQVAYKPAPVWLTEILDPVAGVAYVLDEQHRVAHRLALPPATTSAPEPVRGNREEIGTEIIEGVRTVGTRISGALTLEMWDSPELKVNLVTRSSNGYTTRLINLSRAEPDLARFLPPAGWTVVNHDQPFTLDLPFPPK
jgi:hypothetical protein